MRLDGGGRKIPTFEVDGRAFNFSLTTNEDQARNPASN